MSNGSGFWRSPTRHVLLLLVIARMISELEAGRRTGAIRRNGQMSANERARADARLTA
jgi:hypothetical protein